MKRAREVNELYEIAPAFLEILECNLYYTILSWKDFTAWHTTCRYLKHFVTDGFLGKYTQTFCKEAIKRNQHLLETRKNSLYFQNLLELRYISALSEAIDSIMGPIVFDSDAIKRGRFNSCTLEAFGLSAKSTENEKRRLHHILAKCAEYIKRVYGWDFRLVKEGKSYFLPENWDSKFLCHTDCCSLIPIPPQPQTISVKPTLTNSFTPIEPPPDCTLF